MTNFNRLNKVEKSAVGNLKRQQAIKLSHCHLDIKKISVERIVENKNLLHMSISRVFFEFLRSRKVNVS